MSVFFTDFELIGPHQLLNLAAANFTLVTCVELVEGFVNQETLSVRDVFPNQIVLSLHFKVSLEHLLQCR